ncbi:MAG: hypothetical protein K2X87_10450 [Gemmataceae bacterium]|nr:hypothetical protein [Gemmataceae bacterium]
MNASILAQAQAILEVYDQELDPVVNRLRENLKTAPAAYRKLAADRQAKAEASKFLDEQEAYQSQADLADAAALLCEKRLKEVYAAEDPVKVSVADTLGESMDTVRRMIKVHTRWTEVLDSWPAALNDPKLAKLFDQMNSNIDSMKAFQGHVTRMTTVMKSTAAGKPASRAEAKS